MATASDNATVELAMEYDFKKRHDLLVLSLTAAGAEPEKPGGNRQLARFGQNVIHFVIATRGYNEGLGPEHTNAMHTFFQSKEHRAAVVDSLGIISCMKLCERSGAASKTVKSLALSALIGAAWLDSGSVDTVAKILTRLHHISQIGPSTSDITDPNLNTEFKAVTAPATVNPADILLPDSEPANDLPTANVGTTESLFLIGLEEDQFDFERDFSFPTLDLEELTEDLTTHRGAQQSETQELSVQVMQKENHVAGSSQLIPTKLQRRTRNRTLRSSHDCSQWLSTYIREDQERCKKHNTPSPWEEFPIQKVTNEIAKFSHQHRETFLKIWVGLCSPASVIELRDTIRQFRDDSHVSFPFPHKSLSTKDRLAVIDEAEQKITSWTFLRRLHILKLWQDEEAFASKDMGWVNFDAPRTARFKKPGNPRNAEESQATKLFAERVYPDLDKTSPDYESLLRKIRRLRKLGRRLDMLGVQFGEGILALMPCSDLNLSTRLNFAISDSMLLAPTDGDFKGFLSLLESTQGNILRRFSSAADPIVKCVTDGTLGRHVPFPLEKSHLEQIASSSRGSEKLLSCFSILRL